MSNLSGTFNSIQKWLFPALEEEIGKLTSKQHELILVLELVRPERFMMPFQWSGKGRPPQERRHMLKAFIAKNIYDLPTTKVLLENLKTSPSLRRLCGWEYPGQIPSEATFSRAFKDFAELNLPDLIHRTLIKEHLGTRIIGHSSLDSTAIKGREKACRKNTPAKKIRKKRGRKSNAEKAVMAAEAQTEIKTRRLELQPERSLQDNLADLPVECDWGGKQNSQGKYEYWKGYKLHISTGDGGIPLSALLTSASPHDSQAAIPLMQKTEAVVGQIFYDLADSAYDAPEIHAFSRSLGHVPVIDPNKRRGVATELDPAKKIRFRGRTVVERTNSELKDNYGGRHIRVKGPAKVFCHLMFGIIAIAVKQLFNMLC